MTDFAKPDPPSVTPLAGSMDVRRTPRRRGRRRLVLVLIGCACVIGLTLALSRLRAAAPTVERAAVWIDEVKRGPMLREVQGQGTLVPLDIRWITAVAPARVDRVRVLPGSKVQPDTILVDLLNPDVELQALEADRQLTQAEAELTNLQASLTNQRLAQESLIASLGSEQQEAQRRAAADQALAQKGFLSDLEMATSRDKAATLSERKAFEEKRLGALAKGISAQVQAQRQQVERLRSIAQFRHKEVDALHVRAGVAGVLQELPLQPGQSVAVGALVAKVAQPDRLKAELRVPETQAKDVQLGQKATVDTRNGIVVGKVARIDPAAVSGTVKVDVHFDGPLPAGARPDLSVEGTIELERLSNVLYVGRPAFGQPDSTVHLFKLVGDDEAVRTDVVLGKASVRNIEIRSGLAPGDRVILSDMTQWDTADRVRLR
jgi:multidrug efflux pump subunit AcrA (membrane-fusion protein)